MPGCSAKTHRLVLGSMLSCSREPCYLRARYYDPTTAQFLTRDPMVATTRSPYGYVGGNPLNGIDPSGNCGLWGSDTCLGDAAGWVNNNVVKPVSDFVNNNTFGWCIDGSAGAVVGVVGSGCVVFNAHSFGFTGTFGSGWELPGGASLTTGPMFASGARNPEDLGNHFSYAGATAGEVFPVGGFDGASGYGTCGQSVNTYNPSVGVGVNLPWPFSIHEGDSNTWVWTP